MRQKIKIINPIHYSGWDDLLISHPNYSFFHSSNWASVLSDAYKFSPLYFTLIKQNRLLAIVPVMEINSALTGKRGVSLPFSDYCEPLYFQKSELTEVRDYVLEFGKNANWKYIQIRGGNNLFEIRDPSSFFYEHVLNLSESQDQTYTNLRDSTKRNIKKANREGVDVTINESLSAIREFYRLNCMTRKDHGLPPQPYYFFKKVYEYILSKNRGIVVLASYMNKNIAGAVYFHIGKKAMFKYGASDRTFQNLRPNNLIMWEAIKWYSQNGFESLSLGRTEPENEGLRRFKLGWGAMEKNIKYFKFDLRKNTLVNNSNSLIGAHNKVFNRMPIPLSKVLGSLLYRHFG